MIYTIAPSLLLRQEQKRCAVSIGGPPFRGNGNGGCSGVSGANGGPTLQMVPHTRWAFQDDTVGPEPADRIETCQDVSTDGPIVGSITGGPTHQMGTGVAAITP